MLHTTTHLINIDGNHMLPAKIVTDKTTGEIVEVRLFWDAYDIDEYKERAKQSFTNKTYTEII